MATRSSPRSAAIIKEFDSVDDTSRDAGPRYPTDVYDYWDRGLLGIALDPDFLNGRHVHLSVLRVRRAAGPDASPASGTTRAPTPPGATSDGCVVTQPSSTATRSNLTTNVADRSRLNLISDSCSGDWCQQFPSHAGGALAFGTDGSCIVSGGDGASFNGDRDWGQLRRHVAARPRP